MNAVDLLKNDHAKVRKLFQEYQSATNNSERGATAMQALLEIEVHSKLEEEVFYPAVRARGDQQLQQTVQEGYDEHAVVDNLVNQLKTMDPSDPSFEPRFQELMRNVEHHVQEEESEMLPNAQQKLGEEGDRLGDEMAQRKEQLMQQLIAQQPERATVNPGGATGSTGAMGGAERTG